MGVPQRDRYRGVANQQNSRQKIQSVFFDSAWLPCLFLENLLMNFEAERHGIFRPLHPYLLHGPRLRQVVAIPHNESADKGISMDLSFEGKQLSGGAAVVVVVCG